MSDLLNRWTAATWLALAAFPAGANPVFQDVTVAKNLGAYRATSGDLHGPGGVFADVDNDGFADLYLIRHNVANELYLNVSDGSGGRTFQLQVNALGAGDTGAGTGAVAADYDNDGDLDLFVTNWNQGDVLFRNELIETGSLGFTNVTATAGVAGSNSSSLTAAWGDPDRDGDLDLYVGNHDFAGQRDYYYRNNANGTFTNMSTGGPNGTPGSVAGATLGPTGFESSTGSPTIPGQTYSATNAVIFTDFNNDGWPDLLVTNKTGKGEDKDMLYLNLGDDVGGTWQGFQTDTYNHPELVANWSRSAMGVNVGDIDGDGDFDIIISDNPSFGSTGPNDVLVNRLVPDGTLGFDHRNMDAGLCWGVQMEDFDNDGVLEVHFTNDPPSLAPTDEALFEFSDPLDPLTSSITNVAASAGVLNAGTNGKGSIVADYNRDGLLDLIVCNLNNDPRHPSNNNDPAAFFENTTASPGRYLSVKLTGDPTLPGDLRSSLDAIGARVTVVADLDNDSVIEPGETMMREVVSGSSNAASTSSLDVEFGTGLATTATVDITWPDGRTSSLGSIATGAVGTTDGFYSISQQVLFSTDTDGDGIPDFFEEAYTTPPSITSMLPGDDPEPDGLTNLEEYQNATDPTVADTDGDGLTDGEEVNGLLNPWSGGVAGALPGEPTDPNKSDSDGDTLSDFVEVDAGNGSVTDPNAIDSDGDTLPDDYEVANSLNPVVDDANDDPDNDGPTGDPFTNLEEYLAGTDPQDPDSDNDNYNDGVETLTGIWVSAEDTGTNPLDADSDNDTLQDGDEDPDSGTIAGVPYRSNPNLFNTDGDWAGDAAEVAAGTDPSDDLDFPPPPPALFADNFDVADSASFDAADLTGRRSGTLASDIEVRSSGTQQTLVGMQVQLNGGRLRFEVPPGGAPIENFDWASGTAGAAILAAGAVQVEFDYIPTDDTSTDWVSFNVGFPDFATLPEPGMRVNHAGTDFGILFRNNGGTQFFKNAAGTAGGNFTPVLTARHVVITYGIQSFADGAEVLVEASVDGTQVAEETFSLSGNVGQFGMELGTNEPGTLIDNLTILATSPPLGNDNDADNLPDDWEMAQVGNLTDLNGLATGPGPGAGSGNFDADSLTDLEEYQLTQGAYPDLDPTLVDTDGDTLEDGSEILGAGLRDPTDPTSADTDGDGLSDGVESNTGIFVDAGDTGTNPLLFDTDSDGFRDGLEVEKGSNPLDAEFFPPPPFELEYAVLTDDLSSGVDPAKTYTHAVSGGGAATINGVLFEELTPTASPADLAWNAPDGMSAIAPVNNGDWVPATGGVTGPGLLDLLGGFSYSGGGGGGGSFQTFTLSGLTPGTAYDLRVYLRMWDDNPASSGRRIDLQFENGSDVATVDEFLEDRPGLMAGGTNNHVALMLKFRYVAEGSELVLRAAVPGGAPANSGSFHLYGLSNELIEAPVSRSIAHVWNEENLAAIRLSFPDPPVHAWNLFHISTAMYDAWAAYDPVAVGYLHREDQTGASNITAARHEAISYAAYRMMIRRYYEYHHPITPQRNADTVERHLKLLMASLGYDPANSTTEGSSPAAVGNRVAETIINWSLNDGSNELGGFTDPTYTPVNDPLDLRFTGTVMNDPNHWQPLEFVQQVTQNGQVLESTIQSFVGAHWGDVTPFSLSRGTGQFVYLDPGMPPQLGDPATEVEFKDGSVTVIEHSSYLHPDAGVMIDISPASRGNNTLGTNDGSGYAVNPVTGLPYEPNIVNHADYGRVVAEFWADGPSSETPPGHWNTLANEVVEHPDFEARFGGAGPVLDPLEWDVKMYFLLNASVHDCAVAAWGCKRYYDFVRPISSIRYMGGLGQSTDSGRASYHPDGLPLVPDLIEEITTASSAPGERHEHLATHLGKIAIFAWGGEPVDKENDYTGAEWILAGDWLPYQRDTFVTPAFAGYVSGHSTFSRAAAEVLTLLTGTPYFPGGLGTFVEPAGGLEFEAGPSTDIALQWATYYDASDEAGISRIYGGIHVPVDDGPGRIIGSQCGILTWNLGTRYFDGSILTEPMEIGVTVLTGGDVEVSWQQRRGLFYQLGRSEDLTGGFAPVLPWQQVHEDRGSLIETPAGVRRAFFQLERE
ncbi:phosphoesterase PA-phosphatase [Haloferula helveola]|uniref:Phosphoesterase PA-phosphatase n=1 Tax=Haloferula helveola TaxID=490095 RepID=A0ABM7RK41_9BACT|nr:phosphoesterase PA-phosphatase [Haloferula helveola]